MLIKREFRSVPLAFGSPETDLLQGPTRSGGVPIEVMRELVVYETEDGQWEATYDRLPGFRAQGRNREEALQRLKDAIRIYDPCRCEDD